METRNRFGVRQLETMEIKRYDVDLCEGLSLNRTRERSAKCISFTHVDGKIPEVEVQWRASLRHSGRQEQSPQLFAELRLSSQGADNPEA